jgi:hypothetical protein
MGPGFKRLVDANKFETLRGNTLALQSLAREIAEFEIREEQLVAENSNGRNDTALYVLRKRLDSARIKMKKLNAR